MGFIFLVEVLVLKYKGYKDLCGKLNIRRNK